MSWLITPTYNLVDDPDALAYLAAVEVADGQSLEPAVRAAVNTFVKGCKADGIWPAIKASCILAGARTLSGCLVPLVGVAPTNVNFVAGDYNRKTGLAGNGSTKTLKDVHTWTSSSYTDNHGCVFPTVLQTSTQGSYFEGLVNPPSTYGIYGVVRDGSMYYSSYTPNNYLGPSLAANSLIAISRSSNSGFTARGGNGNQVIAQSIVGTPQTFAMSVFSRQTGSSNSLYSNARLAFYSFGQSLDLALLDARVTTLINAIAAAIP